MDMSMLLTLGIVLMAAGLLLLLADLFIPSGGILMLLALGSMGVGVTLLFRHSTTAGLIALATLFVALPVIVGLLIKFWPHTPIARMAHAPQEEDALPMHQELQHLKGRHGRTLTALKPAGMVDFDGRRVDSLTEGMMIEAGRRVRCVEVRGGTVVVRAVEDGPEASNLDTALFT